MVLTEGNVNFIFLASAKSTSLFLAQYAFGPSLPLPLFCYSAILALVILETRVTLLRSRIFEFTTQYVCANINKSYQPALPISTNQLALAQESKN
jgi:hypothetical protein